MELTKIIFLGLVASSVARPRTVYRFQGDNAEHWLEGAPGISVTGFYSWMSPEGLEFYVKYKADENGYRILESNAIPVNYQGVAADGNQVSNVPLENDVIPISHDGLVVFDSSKIEPEDQAIIDEYNTVPRQDDGKDDIVISHAKNELLATSDKQSEESLEIDPISIEDSKSIEEEQEESTQLPIVNDSAIVNFMEEASSSFGERTDEAEPILAKLVAMSNVIEDVPMVDLSQTEPELVDPIKIVIPMEMTTMQRGGNKRTFTPVKMENGDLTFMELTPISVSLEGVSISSTTEACDLCEMQYDYDFDDSLRTV